MKSDVDLRGYSFLDSLQPQYAAFLGTVAQGFLPLAKDASLMVEISPGIEINRLTDVALKATKVKPGMQIVERYFGLLEIHCPEQAETRAAGAAILAAIGAEESDRIKPRIASSPSWSSPGTERSPIPLRGPERPCGTTLRCRTWRLAGRLVEATHSPSSPDLKNAPSMIVGGDRGPNCTIQSVRTVIIKTELM